MENLYQIITIFAENENISLNTDILETGVLNILALIVILFFAGRDFLRSLLAERKEKIVKEVEEAENNFNKAQRRLTEVQKQINQFHVVVNLIKQETINTKNVLLQADAYEAKKDLKTRFERALATFYSKERETFINVKGLIVAALVKQAFSKTTEAFKIKDRQAKLISKIIRKLEGDLL